MTVSYTLRVANARFGGFSALLFRWRGSIYKLLYKELLVFLGLYGILSLTYRNLLSPEQKRVYAQVARYCNRSADLIPMSFVLGFYVTQVVNRWWAQYRSIPLPDRLMCVVTATVHGDDERGRSLRRTLLRYANLSSVLVLRSVSTRVLRRFPTIDHVVEAGFMSQEEQQKFESLHSDFNKYWIPCVWFTNLAAQARREGRVRDDIALGLLLEELNQYRGKCSLLFHYDWISFPLVYTQVVTIAVYSFFAFCIIGRQFLEDPKPPLKGQEGPLGDLDLYVPLTTLLQFFFYAGWLKVAEQIINPFGEDDDDFETNQLIDRNLQVSLLSVDDMYGDLPPMGRDRYWGEAAVQPPYTVASAADSLRPSFMGSTFNLRMSEPALSEAEMEKEAGALSGSPSPAWARTPLLGRFLGASAPSPAISLRVPRTALMPSRLQTAQAATPVPGRTRLGRLLPAPAARIDEEAPETPSLDAGSQEEEEEKVAPSSEATPTL
ncbi:bestrophin-4 isoform X1 [Phascolarctos cinereus]|uniref:Bestrophin n=1 Tax=Phascolarctos cinereus TaxID=38626 RepID=A0A6P5KDK3_PHACI|nr:bestrophin-4 isoform X1 [Phascolarctos cinereus]